MHEDVIKSLAAVLSADLAGFVEQCLLKLGANPNGVAMTAHEVTKAVTQATKAGYNIGRLAGGTSETLLRERGKLAKALADLDSQLAKVGLESHPDQPLIQVGIQQRRDKKNEPQPIEQDSNGRRLGFAAIANQ